MTTRARKSAARTARQPAGLPAGTLTTLSVEPQQHAMMANGAECYHCHKDLAGHFNKHGDFIGCRRRKDAGKIFFIVPSPIVRTIKVGKARGRAAGVYVPTGKKPNLRDISSDSVRKVWEDVLSHAKTGISVSAIVERHNGEIKAGTVAWALHILTKDHGAVKHLSPRQAAERLKEVA